MATLYDSVDPTKIPANAQLVAGYTSGLYPTFNRLPGLFPNARLISVAIDAAHDADVLDVETGDATPAEAPAWIKWQRSLGKRPTVYCSRLSYWPAVQAAVTAAGIAQPDYWIADYTDIEHLVPGSVCTQWTDAGSYDVSMTDGQWPYSAPVPTPTPTGVTMPVSQTISFKAAQQHVFQVTAGVLWHKWLANGAWNNEAIAGPAGGASKATATFPDQTPMVSVIGTQCLVTVEDANHRAWYFAQDSAAGTWGVNELP